MSRNHTSLPSLNAASDAASSGLQRLVRARLTPSLSRSCRWVVPTRQGGHSFDLAGPHHSAMGGETSDRIGQHCRAACSHDSSFLGIFPAPSSARDRSRAGSPARATQNRAVDYGQTCTILMFSWHWSSGWSRRPPGLTLPAHGRLTVLVPPISPRKAHLEKTI